MITPPDVPYFYSGHDALCVVPDAHRCSAIVDERRVPYFPSGLNAFMCTVPDAHCRSAVVIESYVPYFPSGRNSLRVVGDAHHFSPEQ